MFSNLNKLSIIGLILVLLISDAKTIHSGLLSFALWGDLPYAKNNDGYKTDDKINRLLASMNSAELAFTVFDGDIKDGSSLCTDNELGESSIALFNRVKAPTVYVLGDNEWTDCHRISNGGFNSLERLTYLRKIMFANDDSFGSNKMRLHRQGLLGGMYSENTRWDYGNIVFVGLNVPGSNNNKVTDQECISIKSVRTLNDCEADNAEYIARNAANIEFLHESFQRAKDQKAIGLVVIIQADLGFDLPETEAINESNQPDFDGYQTFKQALVAETSDFNGQVLLAHGDTHYYKVDKPLIDQAHLLKNFTRVETFGSPNLHWVKVTVDRSNPNVFVFEPVIVAGN